ncbi:hypothetical protein ACIPSA_49570 [Streptomyces sp. NPDC086549]|uniref:hypothetical protein n=1 Tax=Streptomyces sp. NPDC086549 TaxID=3365752 RepID=UPI003808832B
MTTRPSARRLLARTARSVGAGSLTLALTYYIGAPAWAVAVCAAVGTFLGVLPQLLPQESEHRRDVWRDWLRHRERMARLQITAAQAPPPSTGVGNDQHETSG